MIELNSNTAQQDIRRVDYYSGNQDKYEKNTQSIQVRNENTGNLVKEKKFCFERRTRGRTFRECLSKP